MVSKSPIKKSVKKYRDTFEKKLDKKLGKDGNFLPEEGQKKVRAAHKETAKELGYTESEASKRQIKTDRAQGKSRHRYKESLEKASALPTEVRKPSKPVKKAPPSRKTKPPMR